MSAWQRMRDPVLAGAAGLAASAYVYAVDPAEPGHFPPCPMKALTGLDCPFCGGLRASHELMHGNLWLALDLNVVVVLLALPAIVVGYLWWARNRWRDEQVSVSAPRWAMVSAAVLLVAFTVVRNLPGVPLGTSV